MKRSLNSVARWFTAAAVALLLLCTVTATAQKNGRIIVPFQFVANDYDFPAGEYNFSLYQPNVLTLFDMNANQYRAALMVRSGYFDKSITQSGMTFKWNGVAWVLSDIHLAVLGLQHELIVQPRPVRELAKNAHEPMPTIFIAMK